MDGRGRDGDHEPQKNRQLCKVFVGGLGQETAIEDLKDHFMKYGEITDAVVIKDPDTKRSRGFGFVTFDSPDSVDACLAGRPHEINRREVEVKQAIPREDNNPAAHVRTKKLFLGGLTLDTEADDVRAALSHYGTLIDVQIMTEKITNKPRGFGFAIFDDCDTVDKCCVKKFIRIRDRDVEVKKAISQEDIRRGDPPRGRGGGRYSRGGDDYGRGPYDSYGRHRDYPPVQAASGNYPRYQSSDYPRHPASDYSRSDYPRSDYPRSDYPRYPASEYPRYPSSDYPRYPESDYPRYPVSETYTGGGGYGGGGGGYSADRGPVSGYNRSPTGYRGGYNSSAYGGGMYGGGGGGGGGGAAGMGDYQQQTASNFGPSRGWYGDSGGGGGGRDRERGGRSAQFHPYRH